MFGTRNNCNATINPGGLRRNTDEENNRSNINRRNWQFGLSGFSDGRRGKRGDRSDVEPVRGSAEDNQR
jgi:hypothetical protein